MTRPVVLALALLMCLSAAPPPQRPAWLGLGFTNHAAHGEEWLIVRYVFPRGPAQQAGVKPGDVITAIDGSHCIFATPSSCWTGSRASRPAGR